VTAEMSAPVINSFNEKDSFACVIHLCPIAFLPACLSVAGGNPPALFVCLHLLSFFSEGGGVEGRSSMQGEN